MKPQRIQLRRTKGWRMPPNTVKVDRATKWGNPWAVTAKVSAAQAVSWFREEHAESLPLHELSGKNLACWCPLDQPCHADVLLELANSDSDASLAEDPKGLSGEAVAARAEGIAHPQPGSSQ